MEIDKIIFKQQNSVLKDLKSIINLEKTQEEKENNIPEREKINDRLNKIRGPIVKKVHVVLL